MPTVHLFGYYLTTCAYIFFLIWGKVTVEEATIVVIEFTKKVQLLMYNITLNVSKLFCNELFKKRKKLNHWQNFYYVSCFTESIFASDAFSVLYKFQLYKTFNKKVFFSDANWLKYILFKIKNVFRINDILKIANIRAQLKTTHCECEFFVSWQ